MAITKEEIIKLADLARIEIPEKEVESLAHEMDSILDYVKIIQNFHSDENEVSENPPLVVRGLESENVELFKGGVMNVFREDQNPNESGNYTDDVLREFPNKENGYLKVKK